MRHKYVFALLSVITAGGITVIAGGAFGAPVYGDADGNGVISPADAILIARVSAGLSAVTDTVRRNGDVAPVNDYNGGSFGDGSISMLDAARVARKASGISTPDWPARSSGYLLEAGNTLVTRQYDAAGAAITGPGLPEADVVTTFLGPVTETVGSVTYNNVYLASSSDGDVQHLVPEFDGEGIPSRILATELTLGNNPTRFDPPLVALKYPLANGTAWNGATTATDQDSGTSMEGTYTGNIAGPFTVAMADGAHTFDNAYRVTISYQVGPLLSGSEIYWFVPFVGPVQHGYTRTVLGSTTTVNPDYRLVSASVHGVLYP